MSGMISYSEFYGVRKTGTSDYRATMIRGVRTGHCVLLQAWGKITAKRVFRWQDGEEPSMQRQYKDLVKARIGHGYTTETNMTAPTFKEFDDQMADALLLPFVSIQFSLEELRERTKRALFGYQQPSVSAPSVSTPTVILPTKHELWGVW